MAKDMVKKKALGEVEVFVDLDNDALVEALKGEPGKKGDPGPSVKGDPGRDSDKAGPPGRAPTQAEIADAVHAYLSKLDLRGKKGDPGKDNTSVGPEPSDGRIKRLIKEVLAERLGG